MVDQLDSNTRSPNPDAEIDDPLAELARIIGYERPAETGAAGNDVPQSSEFDLEAELMRELDVPQIPAIDELDLLESDESDVGAEMGAGADHEPVQVEEAYEADPLDPWLEPETTDLQDWEPVEDFSADALSRAMDEEPVFELDDSPEFRETRSVEDLQDPWATSEFDAEPETESEPELGSYDVPTEPFQDELGQVITGDVGDGRLAPPADIPDDDVLADMFRFELPARQSPSAHSPSYPPSAEMQTDDADTVTFEPAPDREEDFFEDLEGFADLPDVASADEEAEPYLAAATVPSEDQLLFADTPVEELPGAAPDRTAMDFEDFLSSELDSFEQTLSVNDPGVHHDESDVAFEAPSQAGTEAEQGGWDAVSADGDDFVFDDAAEELLADIADDDGMPQHAETPADTAEGWPVDSIEDAVAEELDEELEDMFGVPDPQDDSFQVDSDEPDDLDFDLDLDQVLADTAVDLDSDWAEPEGVASADAPQADDREPEEWQAGALAVAAAAERDEIAEAFLGLVPAEAEHDREPVATHEQLTVAGLTDRQDAPPFEDDWLDGFETADTAEQAGEADYYFDADLISEPDVAVEAVGDIDVPELVHDEPQPVEPDYDTEIEREFAEVVDISDAGTGAAISPAYASTEDWGRSDTAPRDYETSDDYIALERELGAVPSGHAYPDPEAQTDELAYTDHGRDEFVEEPTQRGPASRGTVLALAVLGIAVLAGGGALGWSMLWGDDTVADGGPRIIRADTEPVKVLPENPGGMTVPNQDKAVYDRVAGDDANSPGQPSLVNTAEEPVDVVQRTLDPEVLPLEGRGDVTEKSEERLAADGAGVEGASDAASAPVVSPRRVRTMIVKPDGSIVAREELDPAPEAEAALAQPTPALAEPTAAEAMTAEPAATEAAALAEPVSATAPVEQAAAEPAGAETATAAAEPGSAADVPATDQSIAPVRVVTTQPVRAPVPQNRPADQPVTVVGTVTQGGDVANPQSLPAAPAQSAPPAEVASAPAAAAPAANPGGFYVQIASQPSAEGAQASWQALSSRYNSVIGGRGVDIQRADIPGKGVFHRVRIPAGTRDEANALCSRYKSAGGSCFVSR